MICVHPNSSWDTRWICADCDREDADALAAADVLADAVKTVETEGGWHTWPPVMAALKAYWEARK